MDFKSLANVGSGELKKVEIPKYSWILFDHLEPYAKQGIPAIVEPEFSLLGITNVYGTQLLAGFKELDL